MTAAFAAGPAPSFRLDAEGPVTALEGVGRRALALEADVADADAMAEAVRRTEAEIGPLRHAVNCAGVHDNAPAESMPRAQWQRLLTSGLTQPGGHSAPVPGQSGSTNSRRRSRVAASPSASTTGR